MEALFTGLALLLVLLLFILLGALLLQLPLELVDLKVEEKFFIERANKTLENLCETEPVKTTRAAEMQQLLQNNCIRDQSTLC